MKAIIIFFMMLTIANANIEVKQNIKALYKGVELTDTQKDYIVDNQDENIDILQKVLEREIKSLNLEYVDEKNIISFVLDTKGEISKIKFLKKSDNRKLDKMTKQAIKKASKLFEKPAIKKASKLFEKPEENTLMRFIISYNIGQASRSLNTVNQNKSVENNKIYNENIQRGTTRFQHSSKEYVRVFETSKDGFVNFNTNPFGCTKMTTLLTKQGQQISTRSTPWQFNVEVPKGKYKLLVQTKQTCDVSLQYQ